MSNLFDDNDDEPFDFEENTNTPLKQAQAITQAAERITDAIKERRYSVPSGQTLFVNIGEYSSIASHSLAKQIVTRNLKDNDFKVGYAMTNSVNFLDDSFYYHIKAAYGPRPKDRAFKNSKKRVKHLSKSSRDKLAVMASLGKKTGRYANMSHKHLTCDLLSQEIPIIFNNAAQFKYNGQYRFDNRNRQIVDIIKYATMGQNNVVHARDRLGVFVSNLFTFETAVKHAEIIGADIYIQSAPNYRIAGIKKYDAPKPFTESLTGIYNRKQKEVLSIPLLCKKFNEAKLHAEARSSSSVLSDVYLDGETFTCDINDPEDIEATNNLELDWLEDVKLYCLSNPISNDKFKKHLEYAGARVSKGFEDIYIKAHLEQTPSLTTTDLKL